ncbi:EVE domain-containing protein [Candidatus Parcubacteria bacterium]|nr:EVE domain-containing protein [Candidatus Parcubacteria bacterium]
MNHWLLKTEAEEFSIDDLKRKKREPWSGVRNFQARKNLQSMRKGDLAFIYHTGDEKQIVGVGKVVKEAYPEKEKPWVQVDIGFVNKVQRPVTLAQVKNDPNLRDMVLASAPRLSVQPVSEKHFNYLVKLASK